MQRVVAPSILSADFGNLQRDIVMLDESVAEWIHIDVMDGHFVPNISFGFPIVEFVRGVTQKFLDIHLMIRDPERYVRRFVEAGGDMVTFHIEATDDPMSCISAIREAGAKVGLSLKPHADVELLREFIPYIDMILVMSVEPGFGAQSFIEGSLERIESIREMVEQSSNPACLIEVDGGVSTANAKQLFDAGVDVIVAGSAIFKAADPKDAICRLLSTV